MVTLRMVLNPKRKKNVSVDWTHMQAFMPPIKLPSRLQAEDVHKYLLNLIIACCYIVTE